MIKLWHYWCKAMGSRAYDNDKKDDHIHNIIRTFWFLLHIVTCCMIIAGNAKLLELFQEENMKKFKEMWDASYGEGTKFDLDYGKLVILGLCVYIAVQVS